MLKCHSCRYWPKCEEFPWDESGCNDFELLIRCHNCSEYATRDNGLHYCKFFSKILGDAYYIPSPDGYCDRGKRRNDDG